MATYQQLNDTGSLPIDYNNLHPITDKHHGSAGKSDLFYFIQVCILMAIVLLLFLFDCPISIAFSISFFDQFSG